jgi:hypothetical protein
MSRANENLTLWERLSKTDPKHTKQFTRAGGFKGTAIKPMWAIRRATEEFGPIGNGWGFEEDEHLTIPCVDGQTLVYVRARVWYAQHGEAYWTGPQWGGDFVVKSVKGELRPDDEAFKKALTDAVMKCLAYIGIGADVHMGQFDDQKYIAEVQQHFQQDEKLEALRSAMEQPHIHEAVYEIKKSLAENDLATAASAWFEKLDDDDKKAIWIAPSKAPDDAPFTTQERETIKSTEFRQAYYGTEETA